MTKAKPKSVEYTSVGELAAFLATLDPEMPLSEWGSGGLFMRGVTPDLCECRKLISEPHYAVLKSDKCFKKTELGDTFTALIF